jgi:succinate dehydrogenase / fumarate reductase cytochrome b subunit
VVGKKIVMAATGFVLCGFVLGHMLGNLQIYLGPDQLNAYGEKLHSLGRLLWLIRGFLLLCAALHVLAAVQLAWRNKIDARPIAYIKKAAVGSTYAARTMLWSGPIVGAFLVYHLLHFTTGALHPDFRMNGLAPDVYHNVVAGFQQPAASLFYLIAMVLLGFHLQHGVWSMFQSLGVAHPRYTLWLQRVALGFAAVVVLGNCSIPIAVLTGLVK